MKGRPTVTTVHMHQANTNLSKLVARALAGEVIVLGRAAGRS
jgi:antitoxin (DNA-binding transcriptional repressor) of toxin-antitoxin stability system